MVPRTILALVFVALLVAGCAHPSAPENPPPESALGPPQGVAEPSPDPPRAPAPRVLPQGVVVHQGGRALDASAFPGALPTFGVIALDAEAWEPTVGVDPEGRVFYAAQTNALQARVAEGVNPTTGALALPIASEDGGRTWRERLPMRAGRPAHAYGADPFLHVDTTTGRVFVSDLYAACTWLSWSDDAGETWTTSAHACGAPVNDHQSLFTGPPPEGVETTGYPNAVYLCTNNLASAVQCARSLDGGATFDPARVVAAEPVDHPEVSPAESCARLVHAPEGGVYSPVPSGIGDVALDGRAYLPWSYCGRVLVSASGDAGETWTTTQVADGFPSGFVPDPTLAVDAAGNVYVHWIGDDALPRLARSRDGGASWSSPVAVSPPGVRAATFPALTAGSEGRVALAYYGTTDARGPQARWHAYVAVTLDAIGGEPVFATGRATPEDDPLAIGTCEGRCPGDAGVGDFIGMAHDPRTGRVWVALGDVCYHDACPPERPAGARATVGVQTGGVGIILQ